jgi:transposase
MLTEVERKTLEALTTNAPSPRILDRANAIRLSSEGYKTTQILQAVTRSRATILRWIRAFNRRGTASLACSGATTRL